MPTTNAAPTNPTGWVGAPGSFPNWDVAGSNNPCACVSAADDSQYIRVGADQATTCQDFTSHDFSAIPAGSTINGVGIFWDRIRAGSPTTAGNVRWNCKLGASTTSGTYGRTVTAEISTISRPGGGSWAYADLANIKIGFECDGGGASSFELRYDHYYLVIDYSPGGLFVVTY